MPNETAILAALSELKETLRYDQETGHFFWKARPGGRRGRPGDIAGTRRPDRYIQISVTFGGRRELVRGHRLAWWFMTGKPIPDGFILDHINGDRGDNSWANLRLVTPSQSNMNMPVRADNKSGHRGVWWFEKANKWCAYINANGGKRIHLGLFETMESAVAARVAAEDEHYDKFNRR